MKNNKTPVTKLDIDFGEDADVELPLDPEFNNWIESVAPTINAPTETPRAEMWDAIASRTAAAAPRETTSAVSIHRPRWIWPVAIAAALLAGVGVDRFVLGRGKSPQSIAPTRQVAAVAPPAANDPTKLYKLAAVQTLSQAEALLTAYRASDAATHDPVATRQLGAWGRQVLSSTRLLLDSPAGDDPQLRDLLDDLELVLVQIIRSSGTELNASERALIDRAMKDRDLLPRIRTVVPAGAPSTATE